MVKKGKTRKDLVALLEKHGFTRAGEEPTWPLGVSRPFERDNPPVRIAITPQRNGYQVSIYSLPATESNRQYFENDTISDVYKNVEKYLKN